MRLGVHVVVSHSLPKDEHWCRNVVGSPALDHSCGTPHSRRVKDFQIPRSWHGKCHTHWHPPQQVQENLGTTKAYLVDARGHPRLKLEVDIRINSRRCGLLKGLTIDISESGIAAMLTLARDCGVGLHASVWTCGDFCCGSPKKHFSLRLRIHMTRSKMTLQCTVPPHSL